MNRILDQNGNPIAMSDGLAVPHVITFSSLMRGGGRTLIHQMWDEAYRHSRADALIMRRDAHLMGLLQERKLAVASLNWHLEVPDERSELQRGVRDAITRVIRGSFGGTRGLRQLLMAALEKLWYGRYGIQWRWAWKYQEGRRVLCPAAWAPVNGDKIGHREDGTPYVLVNASAARQLKDAEIITTSYATGLLLLGTWRERFTLHCHEIDDADYMEAEAAEGIHGVGIRHRLFWLDYLRREWLGKLTDFLDRVGLGVTIWYYTEGNAAEKAKVEQAAREQSDRVNIVWPRSATGKGSGAGVERLNVPTEGANILIELVKHLEEIEERYIIGQTLSSKTEGSGLGGTGVASLHADTKLKIAASDAMHLAEELTGTDDEPGLVSMIQKYSFPETYPGSRNYGGFRVRFVFDVERAESRDKLEAGSRLVSVGVAVRADELRAAAGFSKPQEGDEVVGAQQQPSGLPLPTQSGGMVGQSALSAPVRYVTDAQGHEHDAEGKFTSPGTGGSSGPTDRERMFERLVERHTRKRKKVKSHSDMQEDHLTDEMDNADWPLDLGRVYDAKSVDEAREYIRSKTGLDIKPFGSIDEAREYVRSTTGMDLGPNQDETSVDLYAELAADQIYPIQRQMAKEIIADYYKALSAPTQKQGNYQRPPEPTPEIDLPAAAVEPSWDSGRNRRLHYWRSVAIASGIDPDEMIRLAQSLDAAPRRPDDDMTAEEKRAAGMVTAPSAPGPGWKYHGPGPKGAIWWEPPADGGEQEHGQSASAGGHMPDWVAAKSAKWKFLGHFRKLAKNQLASLHGAIASLFGTRAGAKITPPNKAHLLMSLLHGGWAAGHAILSNYRHQGGNHPFDGSGSLGEWETLLDAKSKYGEGEQSQDRAIEGTKLDKRVRQAVLYQDMSEKAGGRVLALNFVVHDIGPLRDQGLYYVPGFGTKYHLPYHDAMPWKAKFDPENPLRAVKLLTGAELQNLKQGDEKMAEEARKRARQWLSEADKEAMAAALRGQSKEIIEQHQRLAYKNDPQAMRELVAEDDPQAMRKLVIKKDPQATVSEAVAELSPEQIAELLRELRKRLEGK